ncbi:histidine phosphatase family protein [Nostoc sp. CHAB 5834]|nr:histidine phosphatase family protein [Nostoc sp. CHAB 5834]
MRLLAFLSLSLAVTLTACSTTTVYLVRHAEKVDETDSTDLNPSGRQRALALADTLANRGIDSIFTTPYRRTRQTAEPLARRLSIRLQDYAPKPTGALVDRVNLIRGKTVLVVGHSNTVLDIARGLGAAPSLQTIESGDYDNLFILRIKRSLFGKRVGITEKTYGMETP